MFWSRLAAAESTRRISATFDSTPLSRSNLLRVWRAIICARVVLPVRRRGDCGGVKFDAGTTPHYIPQLPHLEMAGLFAECTAGREERIFVRMETRLRNRRGSAPHNPIVVETPIQENEFLPEQARSQCAWSVPLGSPVKQQIRIHP